ncbi:MAG: hypothetical protein CFE25_05675 [Chitinophagaceae bacterium BSSC1]|nr:MAG: hypothetical protein CFE25_05675 [Chitinophagaceae bacterium BSSC1]
MQIIEVERFDTELNFEKYKNEPVSNIFIRDRNYLKLLVSEGKILVSKEFTNLIFQNTSNENTYEFNFAKDIKNFDNYVINIIKLILNIESLKKEIENNEGVEKIKYLKSILNDKSQNEKFKIFFEATSLKNKLEYRKKLLNELATKNVIDLKIKIQHLYKFIRIGYKDKSLNEIRFECDLNIFENTPRIIVIEFHQNQYTFTDVSIIYSYETNQSDKFNLSWDIFGNIKFI